MNALGILETYGLTAAILCADEAAKAADVTILGYERSVGHGIVTLYFTGDIESVKAAEEIAVQRVCALGHQVLSAATIPKPDEEMAPLLPLPRQQAAPAEEPHETEEALAQPAQEPEEEPEQESAQEMEPDQPPVPCENPAEEFAEMAPTVTCNLCRDPACPRKKGEVRKKCLHYVKKTGKKEEAHA